MPPEQEQQSFKLPTVIPTPDKSQIVHGIKDACADDALWLVSSVVQYIKETGELGFADEMITYADGGEGTVYEHMRRILDFSARQIGRNGICKGLRADWNDCLNLGGGESAIFSHPNPWAWCAEAVLGRGSRAMKFYNALCPALQNDKIEIRQSEPYSYCQFVVGRSHTAFGRAAPVHDRLRGLGVLRRNAVHPRRKAGFRLPARRSLRPRRLEGVFRDTQMARRRV